MDLCAVVACPARAAVVDDWPPEAFQKRRWICSRIERRSPDWTTCTSPMETRIDRKETHHFPARFHDDVRTILLDLHNWATDYGTSTPPGRCCTKNRKRDSVPGKTDRVTVSGNINRNNRWMEKRKKAQPARGWFGLIGPARKADVLKHLLDDVVVVVVGHFVVDIIAKN